MLRREASPSCPPLASPTSLQGPQTPCSGLAAGNAPTGNIREGEHYWAEPSSPTRMLPHSHGMEGPTFSGPCLHLPWICSSPASRESLSCFNLCAPVGQDDGAKSISPCVPPCCLLTGPGGHPESPLCTQALSIFGGAAVDEVPAGEGHFPVSEHQVGLGKRYGQEGGEDEEAGCCRDGVTG